MSCHSTPANVAVLGYCGKAFNLPAAAVESEFHWLKKIGKDRAMPIPERAEWEEFVLQRERWVKHDDTLSDVRKERTLARLRDSYDQVPDGPTFYALSNLPVRLAQVTDPAYVEQAAGKVLARLDGLMTTQGKGMPRLDAAAATLHQAAIVLRCHVDDPGDAQPSSVRDLAQQVQQKDLKERTNEELYSAQQMLHQTLRLLRRRPGQS